MAGILEISDRILDFDVYTITPNSVYDYYISLETEVNDKTKYDKLLNKELLRKNILESINIIYQDYCDITNNPSKLDKQDLELKKEFLKERINFLKKCLGHEQQLFQDIEYILLDFEIDTILTFLKNNPELRNKKIIINDSHGLNLDTLKKIKQILGSNTTNCYFKLSRNSKLISYDECEKTFNNILTIAKDIKKYNFSPLEQIMYAYDMARNRVYVEVDNDEDKYISRDISTVLEGDKIVCLGYARIFSIILKEIGINSREVLLFNSDDTKGHARNEIFIDDPKYNVKGVFYFDATWNSKKKENDNSYLTSYLFFAKQKDFFEQRDGDMKDIIFSVSPKKCLEILKNTEITQIPRDALKSMNYMARLVTNEALIEPIYVIESSPVYGKLDKKEVIKKFITIKSYFEQTISAETMLKVLMNVRKHQYYENPNIYPYSLNDFFLILLKSKWEFNNNSLDKKLWDMQNPKEKVKYLEMKMIEYSISTNLYKSIKEVELVRALKSIVNKKRK